MATVNLYPTVALGFITQTNLAGSAADVDDSPDSPDGNWLTYISGSDTRIDTLFDDTAQYDLTTGTTHQELSIVGSFFDTTQTLGKIR